MRNLKEAMKKRLLIEKLRIITSILNLILFNNFRRDRKDRG